MYNYSTPAAASSSSPPIPSRSPFPPYRLTSTPPNTPQINTGLIREGGDAEHIAHSTRRKEKVVCHCSLPLSFFLSLSISISCTSAFSQLSLFLGADSQTTAATASSVFFLASFLTFRCVFLGMEGPSFPPSRRMLPLSLRCACSTKQFFIICTACVNSMEEQ